MPLAEKQKFSAREAREWSSKWSYSQGWGQLPKDLRSSSIRRNSAGVTGVSSGSACYQLVDFVATQFSPGIFAARAITSVFTVTLESVAGFFRISLKLRSPSISISASDFSRRLPSLSPFSIVRYRDQLSLFAKSFPQSSDMGRITRRVPLRFSFEFRSGSVRVSFEFRPSRD